MQLRQPHALGVFNHHQAGVGHVHADFYHGGRHQHVQAACHKLRHDFGFFGGLHAPVHQADGKLGQRGLQLGKRFGGGFQLQAVALFNQRAHPIRLLPFLAGVEHEAFHLRAAYIVHQFGFDGRAVGGQLVDGGYV